MGVVMLDKQNEDKQNKEEDKGSRPWDRKGDKRRTKIETESMRKQIFDLKLRGMPTKAIAKVMNVSQSAIRKQLREMRKQTYKEMYEAPIPEKTGDILLAIRRLREEAMFQMTKAEDGSFSKQRFMESASKRLQEEVRYCEALGLMPRPVKGTSYPDNGDLTSVSMEDIQSMMEMTKREVTKKLVDSEDFDFKKVVD